jgi:hypothetical protein
MIVNCTDITANSAMKISLVLGHQAAHPPRLLFVRAPVNGLKPHRCLSTVTHPTFAIFVEKEEAIDDALAG